MASAKIFSSAAAVTPSDSATNSYSALIVLIAGDLVITPAKPDGTAESFDLTFSQLASGTLIPFAVFKVKATNTTATVAGLQ